jgi:hypothetical protein
MFLNPENNPVRTAGFTGLPMQEIPQDVFNALLLIQLPGGLKKPIPVAWNR